MESRESLASSWGDFPPMREELAEEALEEGCGELPLSSAGAGESPGTQRRGVHAGSS